MQSSQKTLKPTKAVAYCRASGTKQVREGHGLESQEARCREFSNYKGYEVVEVFKDDITGKTDNRPEMNRMLSFVRLHKKGSVVVIIDDITRFARNLKAHIALRETLTDAGGILESPSIEFGEDSDSVLVEHLLATVSEHQRGKNAEQTKNRMRGRMLNGYWVFQSPIGYRYQLSISIFHCVALSSVQIVASLTLLAGPPVTPALNIHTIPAKPRSVTAFANLSAVT